jgi:MGT family glycosyltransferase
MARILFTTIPIAGHVRPALPVARHLIAGGHEVTWYTGRKFEPLITGAGARFVPVTAPLDLPDGDVDVLHNMDDKKPGLPGLKKVIHEIFVEPIPAYAADLEPLMESVRPDVVVADLCFMAGPLLAVRAGIPKVLYAVGPLSVSSVDTAPFGTGLPPSASALGRLRNRAMQAALERAVFGGTQRAARRVLAELGVPAPPGFFMDWGIHLADRYLQASVPAFEYPRSDLPPAVEFVGAMLPVGVDDWTPPAWWPDVAAARAAGRPVVLVTQGTANTDPALLTIPAITALGGRDLLLIATTDGFDADEAIPVRQRPANLRMERFIPFTEVMPLADLVITNGGYGGVQMSLSYGVPLVVAGMSEDKMEVNARVAWSGAGISLKTHQPDAGRLGAAVAQVLSDGSYRKRAQQLSQAYAEYPGAPRAAEVILEAAGARSLAG